MWNKIKERLKSPVVLIQLITTICGAVVMLAPSTTETVDIICGCVVACISIIAGLNNPADKDGF